MQFTEKQHSHTQPSISCHLNLLLIFTKRYSTQIGLLYLLQLLQDTVLTQVSQEHRDLYENIIENICKLKDCKKVFMVSEKE